MIHHSGSTCDYISLLSRRTATNHSPSGTVVSSVLSGSSTASKSVVLSVSQLCLHLESMTLHKSKGQEQPEGIQLQYHIFIMRTNEL